MPILNLETKDKAQELIKAYLEQNASDVLADKINHGVLIEKDGKKLINRKTLDGFNVYSFQTVLNGTTYSKQEFTFDGQHVKGCVLDDPELFDMAIHYFEEDSIEGTLYNEDGTEYDAEQDEEEPTEEERREAAENDVDEQQFTLAGQPQGSPFYQRYMQIQNKYPGHIVAFKRGDFYEVLGKNAELFAKAISLPLSERDCGFAERVPMVGFSLEDADNHIAKAIQKGLKIAVADTLGEVKELSDKRHEGSKFYQQYMSAQSNYPDYIVAFRLGDFYEIFGEKAKQFAKELDLTLTGRDCGLAERVPMVGFPCHAANTYIAKAVKKGLKVAVFDSPGENSIELYEPKQTLPDPQKSEKHWIDDTTYIDDDGIVHDIEKETEETAPAFDMPAFDTEALAKLDELFGEIIDLR